MKKNLRNPLFLYPLIIILIIVCIMFFNNKFRSMQVSDKNQNPKVNLSNRAHLTIKGIDFRGDIDASNSNGVKLEDLHAENIAVQNSNLTDISKNRVSGDINADINEFNRDEMVVDQKITDNIVGGSLSANITKNENSSRGWFSMDNPLIWIMVTMLTTILVQIFKTGVHRP